MRPREGGRISRTSLVRSAAGLVWLAAWVVVVGCVHAPWLQLGGLVAENVRYWERVVLASATIVGIWVGAGARAAARPGRGKSHATLARTLLVVPAAAAAGLLVFLRTAGQTDWIGVAFVGFLAYWAGFDSGIGAWPLLRGRHYSLTRAIESEIEHGPPVSRTAGDPWR